jgi:copper chaperone
MSADRAEQQQHTLTVKGMSCEHCARSVTEEVSGVPGVSEVDADTASGRVVVTGIELSAAALAAAVEEAGYEVATS